MSRRPSSSGSSWLSGPTRDRPVVQRVEQAGERDRPPGHHDHECRDGDREADDAVQQVEPGLAVGDRRQQPAPASSRPARRGGSRRGPAAARSTAGIAAPLDVGEDAGDVEGAGEDRQADHRDEQADAGGESGDQHDEADDRQREADQHVPESMPSWRDDGGRRPSGRRWCGGALMVVMSLTLGIGRRSHPVGWPLHGRVSLPGRCRRPSASASTIEVPGGPALAFKIAICARLHKRLLCDSDEPR